MDGLSDQYAAHSVPSLCHKATDISHRPCHPTRFTARKAPASGRFTGAAASTAAPDSPPRGAGVGLLAAADDDAADPEWLPGQELDDAGNPLAGPAPHGHHHAHAQTQLRSALRTPATVRGARGGVTAASSAAAAGTPRRLTLGFIEVPEAGANPDVSALLHLPRGLNMTPITIPSPARVRERAASAVSEGVAATRRATRRVKASWMRGGRPLQLGVLVLVGAVLAAAIVGAMTSLAAPALGAYYFGGNSVWTRSPGSSTNDLSYFDTAQLDGPRFSSGGGHATVGGGARVVAPPLSEADLDALAARVRAHTDAAAAATSTTSSIATSAAYDEILASVATLRGELAESNSLLADALARLAVAENLLSASLASANSRAALERLAAAQHAEDVAGLQATLSTLAGEVAAAGGAAAAAAGRLAEMEAAGASDAAREVVEVEATHAQIAANAAAVAVLQASVASSPTMDDWNALRSTLEARATTEQLEALNATFGTLRADATEAMAAQKMASTAAIHGLDVRVSEAEARAAGALAEGEAARAAAAASTDVASDAQAAVLALRALLTAMNTTLSAVVDAAPPSAAGEDGGAAATAAMVLRIDTLEDAMVVLDEQNRALRSALIDGDGGDGETVAAASDGVRVSSGEGGPAAAKRLAKGTAGHTAEAQQLWEAGVADDVARLAAEMATVEGEEGVRMSGYGCGG